MANSEELEARSWKLGSFLLRDGYVAALGESGVGRAVGYPDGEVHRDRCACFDGLSMLVHGLEAPFAHRLLSCGSENRRPAHYAQILDVAIGADQGLQNHRSLHIHVLRQRRIRRRNRFGQPFVLRGVRCRSCDWSTLPDCGSCRFQDLNSLRLVSGMQIAMSVSSNYFHIKRRQDFPVRYNCRRSIGWFRRNRSVGGWEMLFYGRNWSRRHCRSFCRSLGDCLLLARRLGLSRWRLIFVSVRNRLLRSEPELPVFNQDCRESCQQEDQCDHQPELLIGRRGDRSPGGYGPFLA